MPKPDFRVTVNNTAPAGMDRYREQGRLRRDSAKGGIKDSRLGVASDSLDDLFDQTEDLHRTLHGLLKKFAFPANAVERLDLAGRYLEKILKHLRSSELMTEAAHRQQSKNP
jgi:hypothetical protein